MSIQKKYFINEKVRNVRELIDRSAKLYGNKVAYRLKKDGKIYEWTYQELKEDGEKVSRSINEHRLAGEHIVLFGTLSYEWMASYIGIVSGGAVAILIDRNMDIDDIVKLLNRTMSTCIVYSEADKEIIDNIVLKYPCVNTLFEGSSKNSFTFEAHLIYVGLQADRVKRQRTEYNIQPCTIVFTSGTTGQSKGVMLSQENICSNVLGGRSLVSFSSNDVALSVLPITHMYELTCGNLILLYSGAIIYINENLKDVYQNLLDFKPTCMFLVPLFLDSFRKEICRLQKAETSEEVKEKVKNMFGGKLRRIIVGGAPCKEELLDFFSDFDISVIQGYGITECSPLVSVNLEAGIKRGSVGRVIDGCKVKCIDKEICVKGPNVMLGYYKEEEITEDNLVEGWFKTGDVGHVDEDGFIYILGRKKRLIILDNGENVSPEELERYIMGFEFVSEVLVYEETVGEKRVIVMEIYPDYDEIERKGREEDFREVVIAETSKLNDRLPNYKKIMQIKYRTTPFKKTTSNKVITKGQ